MQVQILCWEGLCNPDLREARSSQGCSHIPCLSSYWILYNIWKVSASYKALPNIVKSATLGWGDMRSNEVEGNKIAFGRGGIFLELGTDWRKTEPVGFSFFPIILENSVSILNTLLMTTYSWLLMPCDLLCDLQASYPTSPFNLPSRALQFQLSILAFLTA